MSVLHNKYYVWSSQRPALYRPWGSRPGSGWKIAGGTVEKLYWRTTPLPPDAILPEHVTIADLHWVEPVRPAPVKPATKIVQGSNGKTYVVTTLPTGKHTCTCPGFSYRRFCKHTGATK